MLSLILATATAFACPGGGGGEERVEVNPRSATFERVGARRTFTFIYWEGREPSDEVERSIARPERFRIVEGGRAEECVTRVRRLSPGGERCTVVVEALRAGEETSLSVWLVRSGLLDLALLRS
jgi:hypothetical protein